MPGPPWDYAYDIDGPVDVADLVLGAWIDSAAVEFGDPRALRSCAAAAEIFSRLFRGMPPDDYLRRSEVAGPKRGQDLTDELPEDIRGSWKQWLWESELLRVHLRNKLLGGDLVACGDPDRPGQDPVWIPIRAWSYLEHIEDGMNSVSGKAGEFFFVRVFDLKALRKYKGASGVPDKPASPEKRQNIPKLTKWYKERHAKWPSDKTKPSAKLDEEDAKRDLGEWVRRDDIRRVRKAVAPEWTTVGRPRLTKKRSVTP